MITLDGTSGLTTPGVVNTAGETIATTLAVTGASTLTGAVTASTTLAVTGVSTFAAGTALLPALTTTGDTNTGLWFPAADTVAASTGGTERMRITSTGNVTVGTDDLGYKLGVFSTSTGTPALNLRSSAAGDAGTAQLRIIKSTNTNTTSQIFAQFVIDGNNTNSGQINANGASAAAFGSFSDVRLKENIVNLPSQLANITALRPVEFDYKDGCGHQIGFIAQEMEQVYPDAIGVGENEMLTITGWSKTEARLVKAIQEQQALITQLQADVAALKALSA